MRFRKLHNKKASQRGAMADGQPGLPGSSSHIVQEERPSSTASIQSSSQQNTIHSPNIFGVANIRFKQTPTKSHYYYMTPFPSPSTIFTDRSPIRSQHVPPVTSHCTTLVSSQYGFRSPSLSQFFSDKSQKSLQPPPGSNQYSFDKTLSTNFPPTSLKHQSMSSSSFVKNLQRAQILPGSNEIKEEIILDDEPDDFEPNHDMTEQLSIKKEFDIYMPQPGSSCPTARSSHLEQIERPNFYHDETPTSMRLSYGQQYSELSASQRHHHYTTARNVDTEEKQKEQLFYDTAGSKQPEIENHTVLSGQERFNSPSPRDEVLMRQQMSHQSYSQSDPSKNLDMGHHRFHTNLSGTYRYKQPLVMEEKLLADRVPSSSRKQDSSIVSSNLRKFNSSDSSQRSGTYLFSALAIK